MTAAADVYHRMRETWDLVGGRFPAYELLLPGSTSFICKAEKCESHCCKVYSVSLGEREVTRMRRASSLQPIQFLESENGEPIFLPLAQPYLLARREGTCTLLGPDLRCGQYHGRPDACRLYPHFVIVIHTPTIKPIYSDVKNVRAAVQASACGDDPGDYVPLLLRHLECPGFTGPPLSEEEWSGLITETAHLQYDEAANP
jgi:Fe-S-cluster containining protein